MAIVEKIGLATEVKNKKYRGISTPASRL